LAVAGSISAGKLQLGEVETILQLIQGLIEAAGHFSGSICTIKMIGLIFGE
jgi:hypothetical protein